MAAKTSRRQVARAVVGMLRDQPAKRDGIVQAAAAYMMQHRQVRQLNLLVKDIARELQVQDGQVFAEVRSAFAFDNAARAQVERFVKIQTGAKSIELDERVAPELLSGVAISTPTHDIDLTARHKLNQLASLSGVNQPATSGHATGPSSSSGF